MLARAQRRFFLLYMPAPAFQPLSTRNLVALMLLLMLGIGVLFGRTMWTMREDEWSFARTTDTNLVRTLAGRGGHP